MVRIGSQLGTCASIAGGTGDNRLGAIKTASRVADRIETTFQVAKRSMARTIFSSWTKRPVRRDPIGSPWNALPKSAPAKRAL